MFGWRCRIGLVTPPDNLLIEPELNSLVPPGVSVHSTRLRRIDLESMPEEAEIEARNYGEIDVDAIAYACSISSFHEGPGSDERIADRLSAKAGVPATTASTAMVRALDALGADRIDVVGPYDDAENDLLQDFLTGNGFDVLSMEGLGFTSTDIDQARNLFDWTAADTYRHVRSREDTDAEAVLIAATNLPSVATIPEMEADVGIPVVPVNVALLWHAFGLTGVNPTIPEAGLLLAADGPRPR